MNEGKYDRFFKPWDILWLKLNHIINLLEEINRKLDK